MKYKKRIILGIGMAVLWSLIFVSAIHNWAGIGIGICFGMMFALVLGKEETK